MHCIPKKVILKQVRFELDVILAEIHHHSYLLDVLSKQIGMVNASE